MDPVSVRGRRGTRVSARFMASKVSSIEDLNNFKDLRVPKAQRRILARLTEAVSVKADLRDAG